jgi:UPF0176 protein
VFKILLFYRFTPLGDPDAIRLWQRDLCESLGLGGRILVSRDGINATVGGELRALKKYVRKTREYPPFKDMEFGWSEGTGHDFPRLSVRVRDELVSFGAPGELRVDESGVIGGGVHLSPTELHELVAKKNVTFFDGRNSFEAAIGRFRGAVVPAVEHTRDFMREIDSGAFDDLKNEPVVTYCTGGIRCEILSSLLVSRGFREVYQLDGGIARYGDAYGDSGLWEGSLYVFDERKSITFSDDAGVLGRCYACSRPTSRIENCTDPACHAQLVVCDDDAASAACDLHRANSGKITV